MGWTPLASRDAHSALLGAFFFLRAAYEQKRMMEAGSCEGCMRACWIDTSSMFRTLRGFYETARLTVSPRTGNPLDHAGAMAWARREDVPIVPEMAASAK